MKTIFVYESWISEVPSLIGRLYVVAFNKRSFLWDVLWDYVDKFALKKEVDRK